MSTAAPACRAASSLPRVASPPEFLVTSTSIRSRRNSASFVGERERTACRDHARVPREACGRRRDRRCGSRTDAAGPRTTRARSGRSSAGRGATEGPSPAAASAAFPTSVQRSPSPAAQGGRVSRSRGTPVRRRRLARIGTHPDRERMRRIDDRHDPLVADEARQTRRAAETADASRHRCRRRVHRRARERQQRPDPRLGGERGDEPGRFGRAAEDEGERRHGTAAGFAGWARRRVTGD